MDKWAQAVPAWARAWDLASANWAASPGMRNRAIRPRAFSAPFRTRRLSTAWASTIPARPPWPRPWPNGRRTAAGRGHPVGINLGKSKMTPLDEAAAEYANILSLLASARRFFCGQRQFAQHAQPAPASGQERPGRNPGRAAAEQHRPEIRSHFGQGGAGPLLRGAG